MPFLTDPDYLDQIKASQLTTLTDGVTSVRLTAEAAAEAQMRSRLAVRYAVDSIFSATGNSRNAEVVMYMVDMVLYHLHSRINPGQVPELRKERYADALDWLNKVSAGDFLPDLPKVGDADGDGVDDKNVVQWGGRPARNPYF
jgi:hypothetical protein